MNLGKSAERSRAKKRLTGAVVTSHMTLNKCHYYLCRFLPISLREEFKWPEAMITMPRHVGRDRWHKSSMCSSKIPQIFLFVHLSISERQIKKSHFHDNVRQVRND